MTINLVVDGTFDFTGDAKGSFKGPVRKGFRPIIWYNNRHLGSTSVSFVSENEIRLHEKVNVRLVILSPSSLKVAIAPGIVFQVGSVSETIGTFEVSKVIGNWGNQKVP